MNNLTTRKIVLGLLLMLVLMFGVQGIVDAVTTDLGDASTSTVDITARQVNSDIGIGAGDDGGITIGSINLEGDSTETITIKTSRIQLTSPTFTTSTVTFSDATAVDAQTTTKRQLTTTSIPLTGYFTGIGKATLTISYTDIATDAEKTAETQTRNISRTHTYTYYVVQADGSIPATTVLQLTKDSTRVKSEGYITGLDGRTDFYIFSNSTGNYPVTYSLAA